MPRFLDRVVSVILLVIPVVLFGVTFSDDFDVFTFGGDVGPAFAPRVYFVVWFGLALAACRFAFQPAEDGAGEAPEIFDLRQLFYVMAIAIATSYGMITIGFVFATIPGFFMFCWAFGYRKIVPLAIISVAGPLAIWAIFTFGFQLILPKSPWFHMM